MPRNVFKIFAESLQLLLDHDAPIKLKNNQGWTPLHEAIRYSEKGFNFLS
jgi:ankyrin repeat protein